MTLQQKNSTRDTVREKVIPVITGANWSYLKIIQKSLSNILRKRELKNLQTKQPYLALHTYF